MNDQTAPTLSRRQRNGRQPENHQGDQPQPKNHGGLIIFLILLSLILLASAPVYGLMQNKPKSSQTSVTTSEKSSQKSSQAASSSVAEQTSTATTNQAASGQTSASQSSQAASQSSQAAQSSADQAATQAASSDTAVLGTNQTLYNFAVTHGTTTDQIYALNPGITAQNYSKYAGQALKIK